MLNLVLKMIGTTLSLWESKEKRKYYDKWIKLKKSYYEEDNRPESERNHAVLDNIEFELHLLVEGLNSQISKPKAKD